MAEQTGIDWTDHSGSFWIGCAKISEACDNCHAEDLDAIRFKRVEWGPKANRKETKALWKDAARYNRKAAAAGEWRTVFANSASDFFDNKVDPEVRQRAWAVIRANRDLIWLILTKRPQNITKMLPPDWGEGWEHVWLGVTAETQYWADRRLPLLLRVPAVRRFVCCEPMLEALDLRKWLGPQKISWVIGGGETGRKNRRPLDPAWMRNLKDQCRAVGVAFWCKQMTARGWREAHALIPRDLRINEFPVSKKRRRRAA